MTSFLPSTTGTPTQFNTDSGNRDTQTTTHQQWNADQQSQSQNPPPLYHDVLSSKCNRTTTVAATPPFPPSVTGTPQQQLQPECDSTMVAMAIVTRRQQHGNLKTTIMNSKQQHLDRRSARHHQHLCWMSFPSSSTLQQHGRADNGERGRTWYWQ